MAIRTLSYKNSLSSIIGQVGVSCGLLQTDPLAQSHAPAFQSLWDEGLDVAKDEAMLGLNESVAQGAVKRCDRALDGFVKRFEKTILIQVKENREAPEYRKWFGNKRVGDIVRYVLGAEVEWVRSWLDPLTSSNEPSMKAFGTELATLLTEADSAVQKRAAAWEATRRFRTDGRRAHYIENVNAQRKATYGALLQLPHTPEGAHLPATFADQFFEHVSRDEEIPPTVEEVQANIEGLQAQLKAQENLLSQLAKAQAEVAEHQKELSAAQAEAADAEKLAQQAQEKLRRIQAKLA